MGRPLGQHFLTDPSILDRIVEAIEPSKQDAVIEVGSGRATLTVRLAPRVGRVVAIEKARELAAFAEARVKDEGVANVTVVRGDALRLEWTELLAAGSSGDRVGSPHKVIGNIPYAVTSPLIDKALQPPVPAVVVYLVQREVAHRLAAAPGSKSYGALSVGVQATATVENVFAVPAGAFRPPPEVESALVRIIPREDPLVSASEREPFRAFVTGLFSQRRKQLVRSLRSVAGVDRDAAGALLDSLGIGRADRVEVLDPQTLVRLFRGVPR